MFTRRIPYFQAILGVSMVWANPTLARQEPANGPKDQPTRWPGMSSAGGVLLPNGWSLKPAGRQFKLGDLPVSMAVHPSTTILAVLHAGYGEHEVMIVDAANGKTLSRVTLANSFSGLAWSADGKQLYVGGGFDNVVYRFDYSEGLLSNRVDYKEDLEALKAIGGIAPAKDGKRIWAANVFGHSVVCFDAESKKIVWESSFEPESYPYALLADEPRNRLYISLWGQAKVAVIDAKTGSSIAKWETQEHPNDMALSASGKTLFVANANRNTVSVFSTGDGKSLETLNTAIDPNLPPGSTPSSLCLTPDDAMLFVANANTNDVAVFNVKTPGKSAPLGFIPTGWYPTAVRTSKDGKTLFIANGKGDSPKANRNGPNPLVRRRTSEYIGGLFQGTLSILPVPGPKEMASYSQTVYACSPAHPTNNPEAPKDNPIPAKVGDKSPITHVVYIIKENRTYDQVFGDIAAGNGDAALCLFGEKITPNHHALVRDFVLLDNFYVESEVSADGHEWTVGAYATDFVERMWPLGYRGDRRAPYPAEGAFEIARPAEGYIWDRAAAKNVSYRSYGEFITNGPTADLPATTKVKNLQGHFDPKFRSYDLDYPDQKRAQRFLEELAEFEKKGEYPQLVILRLPNDHTSGTAPEKPTVIAHLGDNDLALGLVVEGLSKSSFWKSMAIFVVEDDAQNGSDHVDAHRTVALAISPYIKRKSVDSTLYTTASMLRTMELCLGLDPLSQFDASAKPMYNAFQSTADLAPYMHKPANVNLNERNTRRWFGAEVSEKLDLSKEDRADDLVFNEIIWKAVKGKDSPMPPPVRAAFVFPKAKREMDDDD